MVRENTQIKRGLVAVLFGLMMVSLISAGIVSELNPSATIGGNVLAPGSDVDSGSCRTSIFNTEYGIIKIQACEKGDSIEMYRQEYPSGIGFEACFSNLCVDQNKGFEKKLISEISLTGNSQANETSSTDYSSSGSQETPGSAGNSETASNPVSGNYAVPMNDVGSNGKTYSQMLEEWNSATWDDIVDSSFSNAGNIAAVRWYNTEGQCTGYKCEDQLHNGNGAFPELNVNEKKFGGVTDEFSNVLISFAVGNNQARYDKLHRFSEMLRNPNINNLQCWRYYVSGKKDYNNYNDLCASSDSASDASIRILGAYSIACAKQRAGIWQTSDIDYCADYEQQGRAIFGMGTQSHGEVKMIGTRYYLANGYNNQEGSPTAYQSFRPDYYELQFLMDFAEYMNSQELKEGVLDMLDSYYNSLGGNMVHQGKTGKFNADGSSGYQCTDLCIPEYLDNIDSWRAIPALSGLYNIHGSMMPADKKAMFDYWWENYALPYANSALPFEIFSNPEDGKIKSSEASYKTLSMWIPLASAEDKDYAKSMLDRLISFYRDDERQFSGAAYYGGYFSQFSQRALASATGAIDPDYWTGESSAAAGTSTSEGNKDGGIASDSSSSSTTNNPESHQSSGDEGATQGPSSSGGGSSGGGSDSSSPTSTISSDAIKNVENSSDTESKNVVVEDKKEAGEKTDNFIKKSAEDINLLRKKVFQSIGVLTLVFAGIALFIRNKDYF